MSASVARDLVHDPMAVTFRRPAMESAMRKVMGEISTHHAA